MIHLAAPPSGLVQSCARCGEILQDYRDKHFVASGRWAPKWWAGAVDEDYGFTATTDEPTCRLSLRIRIRLRVRQWLRTSAYLVAALRVMYCG